MAAYINKQGGTHSTRLNALAAELWTWCRRRDIIPIASYIPGQDNLIADFLSRGRVLPSEWTLHPQVMSTIIRTLGPLHVDLFAFGTQCPAPEVLCEGPGSGSVANRRLLNSVGGVHGIRFSPDLAHPRILQKVRQDRATVLLIAPW